MIRWLRAFWVWVTRIFQPRRHRNVRVESFNPERRAKHKTMRDNGMSGKQFRNMRRSVLRKMKAFTNVSVE